MANQTISGLSTLTTPSSNALLWVYDVNATPGDRSLSLPNLQAFLATRAPFWILDSISGSKTYSAFARDTRIVESAAGTIDITAGATVAGIRVDIVNKYAAGITLAVTTGAANVTMLLGSLSFEWDGTQWNKIGGMALVLVFTSGTGATWKTPWAGTFKCAVVGGGGGGGGSTAGAGACYSGGGGGGAGEAVSFLNEASSITFTYTVGAGGTAGAVTPTNGGAGDNSTLGDGTVTLTGNGGGGGSLSKAAVAGGVPGAGGTSSGGQVNKSGDAGCGGIYSAGSSLAASGSGGGSPSFGGGAQGVSGSATGIVGSNYGGGGSGGSSLNTDSHAGGAGASGVIVIEF